MREMTKDERKIIEMKIRLVLGKAVSSDYVGHILKSEDATTGNTFISDVIDDVMCASAWDDEGRYNNDDIILAIGRVLMDRLGIGA